MKRTKQVAKQCFLYAVGFYVTWTPITVVRIIAQVGRVGFGGWIIIAITAPLQGLANMLVYLAPMYRKRRREHPDRGILNWVKGALAPITHSVASDSLYPYSQSRASEKEAVNNGEGQVGGREDEESHSAGGASEMADQEEGSPREEGSDRRSSLMAGQEDDSNRRANQLTDQEDDPSHHVQWKVDQEEVSP